MAYKKRFDNRKFEEMRPYTMKVHVLENADGSAEFAMGNTKVIAAVYGPKTLHPQRLRTIERGQLRVTYRMLPFSVSERKNPRPGRREIEISRVMKEAIESSIFMEEFGNAVVDVYIYVVQGDAGTRCASINAASLALADAGIPMSDLVSAVAAGVVDNQVVIDLTYDEEHYEDGYVTDIPVAYNENNDKVTLLQLDGNVTEKQLNDAIKLGIESCKKLKADMQKELKKRYE